MKLLRYIKAVIIAGPVIIYYHFRYVLPFCKNPQKYPLEYRFKKIQKLVRFVLDAFCVEYKIDGLDKINNLKSKCLIISNHLSNADPLILVAESEVPITFVSKIETMKFPFAGKIAKALEAFPLDRNNLMNQIGQIRNIVSYLKDPTKPNVIIYIEGTRNKKPENPCLDFHPGTLKIAMMAGVPLVTAATYGTFRVLDKHSYTKRVLVQFKALKIRKYEEFKSSNTIELAAELKNEIDCAVDEMRKVDLDFVNGLKMSEKRRALEIACDRRVNS